jgi:hypothetical protein
MGYSTIAMTERYSHLGDDNLKNAVKLFEGSLRQQSAVEVIAEKKQG